MTVTEFLEARIAENEAAARATAPGPWEVSDGNEGEWPPRPLWMVTNDEFHNPGGDDAPYLGAELHTGAKEDAEHIARWDPVRVLAECAAKRAILSHFYETVQWTRNPDCPAVQSYSDIAVGLGESIRHLAAVYSDHPDYDKDWAL